MSSQSYLPEKFMIGPTVGYAFGGIGFGATAEYGLTKNIGLGADFGYTAFDEDFGVSIPGRDVPKIEYTLLGFLVTGSYHFMPKNAFDPFVKLGLGYFNWDVKFSDDNNPGQSFAAAYASGIGFAGQIGARYHFSDMFAGRLAIGYPFFISGGIDIAFGGDKSRGRKNTKTVVINEDGSETPATEAVPGAETTPAVKAKKAIKYAMYVGPYIAANGNINTVVAKGYKPSPAFSGPDLGASVYFPFGVSSPLGFFLDLGYSRMAHTMYLNDHNTDATTITETYSYFQFNPSINLAGFVLGLGIGMPLSAYAENAEGDETTVTNLPAGDDYSDFLKTKLDLKLGGSINLVNTESGILKLNILASYTFSGIFKNADNYIFNYPIPADGAKKDYNATPAGLSLGISYIFKIPIARSKGIS